jgi:GABA(A) receptor-associated protein
MNLKIRYREKYSLEQRRAESKNVKKKYPDRIPLIVSKDPDSDLSNIDKEKYLVPSDFTVAQLLTIIRQRTTIGPEKSINLFVIDYNNTQILAPTSSTIGSLYTQYVDTFINDKKYDGYLYIVYTGENVFG